VVTSGFLSGAKRPGRETHRSPTSSAQFKNVDPNLGCLHPVACDIQVMGGLFCLHNVTIVDFFYYLILLKLLHVPVVRPSSCRNILARIYSTDDGSVA
jgi:hypothetical protein